MALAADENKNSSPWVPCPVVRDITPSPPLYIAYGPSVFDAAECHAYRRTAGRIKWLVPIVTNSRNDSRCQVWELRIQSAQFSDEWPDLIADSTLKNSFFWWICGRRLDYAISPYRVHADHRPAFQTQTLVGISGERQRERVKSQLRAS